MSDPKADEALCARGLALLEDQLGPMQALRFLALISRQPFDYQRWRREHFGGMGLAEILTRARATAGQPQLPAQEGDVAS
jgi:hypothetical protein